MALGLDWDQAEQNDGFSEVILCHLTLVSRFLISHKWLEWVLIDYKYDYKYLFLIKI